VTDNVLLTGRPGCGKTTLIKCVVKSIPQNAGGFFTEEIRETGIRVGFKLVTLDGNEAVFAHVDLKSSDRIGKYRLDRAVLESVGVKALREAILGQRAVVIDEIGPMEIRSDLFRETVSEALDSTASVLATIVSRSFPFTDTIKRRHDVTLIEVRPDNRERLAVQLTERFGS
jgi:nucleoside-triphosphatase